MKKYKLTWRERVVDHEGDMLYWAANSMNWSDVKDKATCVKKPDVDFVDGWCNGEWKVA